jgi:hypothetical protein
LVGSQVALIPSLSGHAAVSLTYQTQVNVQAFTASFTFIPNGWATSFIINNSNNNPDFNENVFAAGAGCEADFFQGYSQTNPPNYVFALDFDSYNPLINGESFSYSSAQIYTSSPGGYVQCPCQSSNEGCGVNNNDPGIDKISTSPVPLNSPVNSENTTTGDTYSATVTYDGSNFTLNLYDVTAGGSCPGPSCFTHTWTNVDIPSSVGGNTAWVGFGGSTGSNPVLDAPLNIDSFVYNEGTPTSTPIPTQAPTPKPNTTPTVTPTATSAPTPTSTPKPAVTPAVTPMATSTATPASGGLPSIVITSPGNGATVSGTITVFTSVANSGSDYTKWYLPNAPVNGVCAFGRYDNAWNGCSLYGYLSFSYSTALLPNGSTGFYVTLVNSAYGIDASSGVGFTVANGTTSY